jgi:hypothetical protein
MSFKVGSIALLKTTKSLSPFVLKVLRGARLGVEVFDSDGVESNDPPAKPRAFVI